tara:strand:+ start:1445 stop:2176 length:732 start_codon:yes stop_codon:yes gene_type:complete
MGYPNSSNRPTDLQVENQSFPSFRSDLNKILENLGQFHAGTSRPTYFDNGMMWLDITDSANPILKFYDGTDDITFATFNTSANTVNVSDSSTDVVGDTSPQLGGNLDVNGNSIVSTSNGDINLTPNGTGRIVLGKASVPAVFTGTNLTLDFDTYQNFILTLSSGSNSLANPSTEASNVGQTGVIIFIQPSSSSAGTVSLGTDYETVGAGGLTLSSANNDYDVVPYVIKADNSILLGTPQLNFG